MTVVAKGGIVYMIPETPTEALRGFVKGIDTDNLREEGDR